MFGYTLIKTSELEELKKELSKQKKIVRILNMSKEVTEAKIKLGFNL